MTESYIDLDLQNDVFFVSQQKKQISNDVKINRQAKIKNSVNKSGKGEKISF